MKNKVFKIFNEKMIDDIEVNDMEYVVMVQLNKDYLNDNVIVDKEILNKIKNSKKYINLIIGERGEDILFTLRIDEEIIDLDLTLIEEKLILSKVMFNMDRF